MASAAADFSEGLRIEVISEILDGILVETVVRFQKN